MALTTFLQELGLFEDLTSAQLESIAALAEERAFSPDEVIVEEYTRGDDMYFIREGLVDIRISAQAGPGMGLAAQETTPLDAHREMITIARLLPGQSIGEVSLVDDGLRSATAVSVSDSVLIRIGRDDLLALCDADPRLGYVVMRNIAADLAFKMRSSGLVLRGELWKSPEESSDDTGTAALGFDTPLPEEPEAIT